MKPILRSSVSLTFGIICFLITSCTCPPNCVPPSSCPASYIKPMQLTPGPLSQTASIELGLTRSYLKQRIASMVDSSGNDPNCIPNLNPPQSGAFVDTIKLEQKTLSNGETANLVSMHLTPWMCGQDGKKVSLNNTYALYLRLRPYIVNPTTVPDPASRASFLCNSAPGCTLDEGILLGFEFHELDNLSQGTTVATAPSVCVKDNVMDDKVLESIWGQNGLLTKAKPFVLPTAPISTIISSFTGQKASALGVSLGTDGDFKLGILLDPAKSHDFISSITFDQNTDWQLNIDAGFITQNLNQTATEAGKKQNSHKPFDVDVQRVDTSFKTCGSVNMPINDIDLLVDGAIHQCGTPHVAVCAHAEVAVCRDASTGNPGKTVLMTCTADNDSHFSGTWAQYACIGISDYVLPVFEFWNGGQAYVTTDWGPCGDPSKRPVLQFEIDPKTHDTFYATELTTSSAGGFLFSGRSTVLDNQNAANGVARPSLPLPCNWNYLKKVTDQYQCDWSYLKNVRCQQ